MGLFSTPEVVILKAGSSAQDELAQLEALEKYADGATKRQLCNYIRTLRAGIAGEDRIMYELKNSHMYMVVLQDLFLEHAGLTAQIDFLVLTRQRNFVIECKSLYGNIRITPEGDFIRQLGGNRREGMYSPVTQNRRHLELIHTLRRDSRGQFGKLMVDIGFDDVYKPLVVLANPKTVLNDRAAPPEVKRQIVRADRLISTIKTMNDKAGVGKEKVSAADVRAHGEWFLSQHRKNPVDYVARYRELIHEKGRRKGVESAPAVTPPDTSTDSPAPTLLCPRCGAPMVLRIATRGARAGKQFWGCSTYPACKGIVNAK